MSRYGLSKEDKTLANVVHALRVEYRRCERCKINEGKYAIKESRKIICNSCVREIASECKKMIQQSDSSTLAL